MKKFSAPKIVELIFDILYLMTVLFLGIFLLINNSSTIKLHFGVMALILVFGDSFHLIPRIILILKGESKKINTALNIGKLITSITMTVFYILLWNIGLMISKEAQVALTIIIYVLAIIRIVLCLCPKNKWLEKDPPLTWAIYRNFPFLLQGLIVFMAFVLDGNFIMGLAIFLSFAFYVPVVLFSQKKPKIGMLMLPKSLVYIWIIAMGFFF